MAKMAKTAKGEAAKPEGDAAAVPKRSKTKLLIGGGLGLALILGAGGYVALPMVLGPSAPVEEVAEAAAAPAAEHAPASAHGESAAIPAEKPLPVEKLVSRAASATDYEIVSIYDGEAYLATPDNLIRIKVGSTAPGIGDVLSITASESGGVVVGSLATLKTT